jgi:hypothetical protein
MEEFRMAKFVSLKLSNDSDRWVIDLERGVVSLASATADAQTNEIGRPCISGVEVAIAAEMREDAFSGKYDK